MDYLKGLNDGQKQAVLTTTGPLLVLAGAGAGKTRVIAHRILHIVRGGVAPERVLAITFTNKAAGEMRERVRELLGSERRLPFVSTFHSLGLTLIKENLSGLGLRRAPAIYDRADSMRAMKEALKSVGAEGALEPRATLGFISKQKGEGVGAGAFAEAAAHSRERLIAAAWLAYERTLSEDRAFDFDDLLLRAVELLRKHETLRKHYHERFTHLLIDEYQDTNKIQNELAGLLVGSARNVCAVGDVDQTIYGWRGAQIQNILSFEKTYPGTTVVVLDENYRSTKTILAAANDIIVKNVYRPEKHLFTRNGEGERLGLYQAFDEIDEGAFVARKVSELRQKGARYRDIAVLYRANFQSRAIEEALLANEIPYQVLGTRFFERKEVKDVLAYIRAALYETPADIARAANTPARGIGKVTLLKLLSGKTSELRGAVAQKVAVFKNVLAEVHAAAQTKNPVELVALVMRRSGIEEMLKADKLEGRERLENLRELGSLAGRHETIEGFLESVALASEQDELKEETDAVRLMTVHASKGLEFPYVFITGLEEGLFPYEREEGGEQDKEEERRLMYVALTRAMKRAFLSYASYRTVFGSKNATLPSQFLTDIAEDLLEQENPERIGRTIYLD